MDDVGSFERFLDDALPGLLRYATVLTGSADAAADVVQEVMVRVCTRWRSISTATVPAAYVHRMVTNEWLGHQRRWFTRRVTLTDDMDAVVPAQPGFEDSTVLTADLHRRLYSLTARGRAVVVLRYFGGYDDADIAAELGCAVGTVRSLHSRALAALRIGQPSSAPAPASSDATADVGGIEVPAISPPRPEPFRRDDPPVVVRPASSVTNTRSPS